MRLVFSGLERAIEIEPGIAATVQITNQHLFARIAQSLQSGEGDDALEPYTLWNGETEVKSKQCLMVVSDPLNLPWDDRAILGAVVKRMKAEYLADEDLRRTVETACRAINASLYGLTVGLDSSYAFSDDWDFDRYLKVLGFGAMVRSDALYLDKVMDFLSLVLDSGIGKAVAFVNLKTFFTKDDLNRLFEHVFYTKLPVLLIENKADDSYYEHERKTVIDQDFLEY